MGVVELKSPKISVALPVHNGENFLREAVDSMLAQTYGDFELLICDNASTDGTAAIAAEYAERDARVRVVHSERNIGPTPNFNRGFDLTTGEYFKWLAHDDYCAPTFLERCLAVMEADPNVACCSPRMQLVNADRSPLRFDRKQRGFVDDQGRAYGGLDRPDIGCQERPDERFADILRNIHWAGALYGLMRRDALGRTRRFVANYGSDKLVLAELSLYGRFVDLAEPLYLKRCHERISHNLPHRQKLEWNVPTGPVRRFPQVRVLRCYVQAVNQSDINLAQKARCLLAIGQLLISAEKWRKLLVPGPHNYLGIDFGRRAL